MNRNLIKPLSLVAGTGLIAGAILLRGHNTQNSSSGLSTASLPAANITQAELAAANGRNSQRCLVAIDGIVYEIKDSPYWVNGYHTTSQGKAYCGLDLSAVIDQAPHGRSVLDSLPKVGRLAK